MSQERLTDQPEPGATRFTRLRRIVPFVSGGVAFERMASNRVLRRFENRVSLLPVPSRSVLSDTGRRSMKTAARRLVEAEAVSGQALVEVRPLVPADDLIGGLGETALAVDVVTGALQDEGMRVVPNKHPIMPVEKLDGAPIDDDRVWQTIGTELDLLSHQAGAEHDVRNGEAAMIMVANPNFARRLFAPQLVREDKFTGESLPVVLSRIGATPRDHVFVPAA